MKLLKMFNLVRNENMKLYTRISTWIMVGILVVAIALTGIVIKAYSKDSSNSDWKTQLTQENDMYQKALEQPGLAKSSQDTFNRTIKINEYRLEHDIAPIAGNSLWGFENNTRRYISLIAMFSIIIAAGIVANEFSTGTIKLLLIRPSSRFKILLSKYICTLLTALFMLVILFVFSFLLGGILFGFKGTNIPYLTYHNDAVKEMSMVGYIWSQYGLSCISLVMMVTFAFMISSVFRNSSLAVGLSIFLYLMGSVLVSALSSFSWVKYILFANVDLSQYIDGTPLSSGMTMQFSIIVLIIYFVVFNAVSWIGFMKRDVAA